MTDDTVADTPCDLVVPVYNGLSLVQDCLESIQHCTDLALHRLIIVDDGSDAVTRGYLETTANAHPRITLHRNAANLGFVKSCNTGMALGDAPFVVLVNSDVIVTPGWLERLLECAASDPRIGSVNPLTNQADQIDLPMATGANFLGMDEYLKKHSPRRFPDVVTGVGFCLLLRRAALRELGLFDEAYGRGYGEDSDLCMRLNHHGWRTVVADHVYVYHKGQGSFTDRAERYLQNRRLFDQRWGKAYRRQFRAYRKANPLGPVRRLFAMPQVWDPKPCVWQTARQMLAAWRAGTLGGVARSGLRGLRQLPKARRDRPTPEAVRPFTRPHRLRVTYVLKDLVVSGGVLSVMLLVNELILLGVEARIAVLFEDPAVYDWCKLLTRPMIFGTPAELIANCPDTDIAVATLWSTAPWVAELQQRGRARHSVYFLQAYEPWFFPENDPVNRDRVRATYGLIPHRIVMSEWLRDLIARDGYETHKIHLGMDLARFYPRDVAGQAPTLLVMTRPHAHQGGFAPTIAALAQVKQTLPATQLVLFGDRFLSRHAIPFEYRDEGIVTRQDRLAELYSEADVFLDGSDYQGFGRCALEAMACGAACVLTNVGGVNEYARHEENALLVPPRSPELFAQAMLRLLDDADLRQRLRQGGFETVKDYSHKLEARRTLDYFRKITGLARS